MQVLEKKVWWSYIEEDLRELLLESRSIIASVETWKEKFHDYSFVVFPAAKAYEGFLKKIFLDMGFIDREQFYGKRFRVGKALNPALEQELRSESVYDKIVNFCGGDTLADTLWQTWKEARNLLFHYFPDEENAITFDQAKTYVEKVIIAMDLAFKECKIDNRA